MPTIRHLSLFSNMITISADRLDADLPDMVLATDLAMERVIRRHLRLITTDLVTTARITMAAHLDRIGATDSARISTSPTAAVSAAAKFSAPLSHARGSD